MRGNLADGDVRDVARSGLRLAVGVAVAEVDNGVGCSVEIGLAVACVAHVLDEDAVHLGAALREEPDNRAV